MNTNLSRYRSQSLQVLLDNAQGDSSQDSRTSKLQKKNSETAQFNRSRDRLDQSKHVSVEFLFKTSCSLSPKRIRVSDLHLLVYKENTKHIFIGLFKEKSVPLSHLGFCTQKTLSCLLPVLFLEESQDLVLQKLLPSLASHQRC